MNQEPTQNISLSSKNVGKGSGDSLSLLSIFKVKSSTQGGSTRLAWRLLTVFLWQLWWTSSSCVCTVVSVLHSTLWTISGRWDYWDLCTDWLIPTSWTDSRSHRPMVPCAISSGPTPERTSGTRGLWSTSVTTTPGDALTSTGYINHCFSWSF